LVASELILPMMGKKRPARGARMQLRRPTRIDLGMEHKGIQYQVVQTANPTAFKWIVHLDAGRTMTGVSYSMKAAALEAQRNIDKAHGFESKSATVTVLCSAHLASLQQHIAVITNLIDQLRELDQLRDRVWKAQLTARRSQRRSSRRKRRRMEKPQSVDGLL
jgi:hypothetical protein